MARSRNVKPGFFKNEELAECSHVSRLFFIGLWTLADRNGLLEFRPRRISAELFPYEPELNVFGCCSELHRKQFIRFLQDEKCLWMHIATFVEHQNPHKQEKTKNPHPGDLQIIDLPDVIEEAPNLLGRTSEEVRSLFGSAPASYLLPITSNLLPLSRPLPGSLTPSGTSDTCAREEPSGD